MMRVLGFSDKALEGGGQIQLLDLHYGYFKPNWYQDRSPYTSDGYLGRSFRASTSDLLNVGVMSKQNPAKFRQVYLCVEPNCRRSVYYLPHTIRTYWFYSSNGRDTR